MSETSILEEMNKSYKELSQKIEQLENNINKLREEIATVPLYTTHDHSLHQGLVRALNIIEKGDY